MVGQQWYLEKDIYFLVVIIIKFCGRYKFEEAECCRFEGDLAEGISLKDQEQNRNLDTV